MKYRHEKFRIRYYNDDTGRITLEIKCKINNLCSKESILVTKKEVHSLLSGDLEWMKDSSRPLAAGMIPLAVFRSIAIGVILLIFVNRKSHVSPYILAVTCEDQDAEKKAANFIKEQALKSIVKSKTVEKGRIELNLEVRLKNDNTDFINVLADQAGVTSAILVSYNGDYMG